MTNLKSRELQVRRVLWITLFLNIFVALIKYFGGRHFHIVSLTSSGLDSFFDSLTNVMGLTTLYLAARPADSDHNYGHHKFETIGSIFVGVILLVTSYEVAKDMYFYVKGDIAPFEFSWAPFIIILVSLTINFFTSRYERKKGKELNSALLEADAHHTFGDSLIGVGILASMFAKLAGIHWVDIAVGCIIFVYLLYLSLKIISFSLPDLLDGNPLLEETLEPIITSHDLVESCSNIRSRGNKHTMFVDFSIQVNKEMNVALAHKTSHEVEDKIREYLSSEVENLDITVHIEPYE